MLPAIHRMRRPAQFSETLRRGRSAARGTVVVCRLEPVPTAAPAPPTVVGLIVGRGVGGSVVRNRVSRRLRAQLASRLDRVPAGTQVVVRARASAAQADSAVLGADLDRALVASGPNRATRS